MKKLYIAIDFDGTIVEDVYPTIGPLKPNVAEIMRQIKADGHQIIINTCRTGSQQESAAKFLNDNHIPFDVINANHPDLIERFGNDCRKLGADIYIDDKCIFAKEMDWLTIGEMVRVRARQNL